MQDYNIYLKDSLEAINKIEKSIKGLSREEFTKNPDIMDATLMRIQVVGESIKKLPLEIKKKYNNIEWSKISKTRDVISHAYSKVNVNIIWDLIKNKFPKLKEQMMEII